MSNDSHGTMIHIFGPPTPKETMDKPLIQSLRQWAESTPLSIVFVPGGFRTTCLWITRPMTTKCEWVTRWISVWGVKGARFFTRNVVFQGSLGRDHEPRYGRPCAVRSLGRTRVAGVNWICSDSYNWVRCHESISVVSYEHYSSLEFGERRREAQGVKQGMNRDVRGVLRICLYKQKLKDKHFVCLDRKQRRYTQYERWHDIIEAE